MKIHDKVKTRELYIYENSSGETVERVEKGTTGVVVSISLRADYASGFAVTWRSELDHKKRKCCKSILEVI